MAITSFGGRYTPARSPRVLDDHEGLYHAESPTWGDVLGVRIPAVSQCEPETWPAWTDLPLGRVLDAIEQAQPDQDQPLSGVLRDCWEHGTIRGKDRRKGGAR